jgi:hypothetical protein
LDSKAANVCDVKVSAEYPRPKTPFSLLIGDVQRAKSELAKHCTEITLTPKGQTYQISGDWNLLGRRSDGAGGPVCTVRATKFSLPIAA